MKDLKKQFRDDLVDTVEKIGIDPEQLGLERKPEQPPPPDPNDQHLEETQLDDLQVLTRLDDQVLEVDAQQDMNYIPSKEEAEQKAKTEEYNARHPSQDLDFSDDCIIVSWAKDPGGVQQKVNEVREVDDVTEAYTYMSEKEREKKLRERRRADERNPEEIDLDEPDGVNDREEKERENRRETHVMMRINNFESNETFREKLASVWEVKQMRRVVRQAVAFAEVMEIEHTEKDANGNITRVWHTHEARPAELTDAYKYGAEVPISTPEDNKLFVDNVYARLAMLKELAQKDTKTRVICVYQVLVASYSVGVEKDERDAIREERKAEFKRSKSLKKKKGGNGKRKPVQNKGKAKDGGDESDTERDAEAGDGGGS
jgi:hypothetical protein